VNFDETSWLLFPTGLVTWQRKGAKDVHVQIARSEKENITVLASITAGGDPLPLLFVAKGKTETVHRTQIGDVGRHWVDHTESGWTTEQLFGRYMQHLRNHMGPGELHLILDCYTAHRTEVIKRQAADQGITLHFVPPGLTDEFQPLDRKVFGVLKANARALFHTRMVNDPFANRTKIDAVQDMINCWEHLDHDVIEDAWEIYMNDE
jgi:hypothetical protein